MKRHWRLSLHLFAILIAAGLFLLPSVRWPVIGWARGEAFYQGMPTSYWHNEIQTRYEQRRLRMASSDLKCATVEIYWERQPTAWEEWFDKTLARSQSAVPLKSEEEAIPVLKELFVSGDIKVRRFAAERLWGLGEPLLYEAAESDDEQVRREAIAGWQLTYQP
jgi:hypothetical protein